MLPLFTQSTKLASAAVYTNPAAEEYIAPTSMLMLPVYMTFLNIEPAGAFTIIPETVT
jgi:hypothetical protein